MAKIGTIGYAGHSGTEYTFELYPMGTTFKNMGAVYIVTKRVVLNDKGTHTLLYIGKTEDLSTRFDAHHKQDCFDARGGNCIGVYLIATENKRSIIEEDLISAQKPPCNEQLTKK